MVCKVYLLLVLFSSLVTLKIYLMFLLGFSHLGSSSLTFLFHLLCFPIKHFFLLRFQSNSALFFISPSGFLNNISRVFQSSVSFSSVSVNFSFIIWTLLLLPWIFFFFWRKVLLFIFFWVYEVLFVHILHVFPWVIPPAMFVPHWPITYIFLRFAAFLHSSLVVIPHLWMGPVFAGIAGSVLGRGPSSLSMS